MTSLSIAYRDPHSLSPSVKNSRTHSDKQIEQLARSIERFGFNNPVLLDRDDGIIAGHGRVAAAKLLKLMQVPTVRLEHLNAEQRRAYLIADNRLAELAGWDEALLATELRELSLLDVDFEITDLGFEIGEIDLLIERQEQKAAEPEAALPAVPKSPVSRLGDLWAMGPHLLSCADALDPNSYRALLGADKVPMIFTDPPFNLPIDGHVSGLGRVKHDEFAMASGEMSKEQFTAFLTSMLQALIPFSAAGSLCYICMDWRHCDELLAAGNANSLSLKNICVWVKSNAGMGSLYRSQHEFVFVWKNGAGKHLNNVALGRYGRNRTNIWSYAGMSGFQRGRSKKLAMHPTVKPTAMVADAILDCTKRGDLILDPFGGSGTTLMAAERTGRRARLIEIEPAYVDVTLQRYLEDTSNQPVHVETGKTFFEMMEARRDG